MLQFGINAGKIQENFGIFRKVQTYKKSNGQMDKCCTKLKL